MTTTLAPTTTRRAILGIVLCEANVSGLAFDGNESGNANARLTGIYHLNASGTVSDCSFESFRGAVRNFLIETGYIAANAAALRGGLDVTHVEVLNNTFRNNECNIIILGDDTATGTAGAEVLRQSFLIQSNDITGHGVEMAGFEFGVRIGAGASGQVRDNTIRDFLSVGFNSVLGSFGSAGILVFDIASRDRALRPNGAAVARPVLVEGNVLANNASGIDLLVADGSRAVNNVIECTDVGSFSNEGAISVSGNNLGAINNHIFNSSIGVNLLANPTLGVAGDVKVIANRISGAAIPITEQAGVTGTKQHANKISP